VRHIDRDPTKARVAESMIALCHDLGIVVVAEGIECTEERDALLAMNVDLMQGYLFAVPGRGFSRSRP
jgi:EAL domain-containing protein (putative c-di-GMP-specific phosphodiesterase class I)